MSATSQQETHAVAGGMTTSAIMTNTSKLLVTTHTQPLPHTHILVHMNISHVHIILMIYIKFADTAVLFWTYVANHRLQPHVT